MSEFQMVEEFQRFLEALNARDPEFVRREIYFMGKNCADEGLLGHVPLYPLFLNELITAKYHRFGALVWLALDRIMDVITDPEHPANVPMRSFLTIPPEVEQVLRSRPRGGMLPRVVRPDTVLHGNRIIAHEFNVSWPGGISDSDLTTDVLAENTLFKMFAAEMAAQGVDIPRQPPYKSTTLLLEQLVEAAELDNPYIAVVIPTPDVSPFGPEEIQLSRRIFDFFIHEGFDADFIHPHQVEYDHWPHYQGRRIDVMYRIFEWGHVMGTHRDEYGPILQAYMDGKLPVVNAFHSEAVSAKSIFELLHCRELHWCFDDMPLEELLETIPYTVNVRQADSPEQFLEEKERWVFKKIKGSASDAVLLGVSAGDDVWREVLQFGLETGGVVAQEYVDTPIMLMAMNPGEDLVQVPRYLDVNPFYFAGKMGNFFSRFSEMMMTSYVSWGGGILPVVPMG
ncbi:MAG: hypothetical protein HY816_04025 [Candidatus Wallbacteria bacterium]|nr:hypothetical protein [Candidatus Wallbacteria bacterium]